MSDVTEDGFLDNKLRIRQPRSGFRAGLDAVMLAAAIPAEPGQQVLELGAGVGTASLCLATRSACHITGIEIDPALVALANQNAALNGCADRVRFLAGDALNLKLNQPFSHVLCNPPFHDSATRPSPHAARARALREEGQLKDWVKSGLYYIDTNGSYSLIIRADRVSEVLEIVPEQGTHILPLLPQEGAAPKRAILRHRPAARHGLIRLPGLVLHPPGGGYTPEADAILRGRADLLPHFNAA